MRTLIGTVALLALAAPAPAQDEPSLTEIKDAYHAAIREKRWEKFRELAEPYCAANPKQLDAHFWMAESYLKEGNPSAALPWLQKSSDIAPTHFELAFETGLAFMRYKDSDPKAFEKALPYLERAVAARAASEPDGIPQEERLKMCDFILGPALVQAHYECKAFDKCREVAAREIEKQPLCSIPCYYLGLLTEEADRATAIDLYKKGAAAALDKPFVSVFHQWGIDDKRSECNDRANYLSNTIVRYGELQMEGLRFHDAEKSITVTLPHPKLLKLKKGERHPWCFWFPSRETDKPDSINPSIIQVVRPGTGVGNQLDVQIFVKAAAQTVSLNFDVVKGLKLSELEKTTEGMFEEFTKHAWVDVTGVQPLRKTTVGARGTKGYEFSWTGKEKAAADNVAKARAEGKRQPDPATWTCTMYVAKGKTLTWWIHVQSKGDFAKRYQKEIFLVMRGIDFE